MPPQTIASEPPHPSERSQRGLDWFIFFLADVQTGFGPFIAVYLTSQKWTQTDIGLVLSMSGIIALILQMPGGALVDWARRERLVAAVALMGIAAAALTYALLPVFPCCCGCRRHSRGGKLRAGSLRGGDESRSRRARGDRRTARA